MHLTLSALAVLATLASFIAAQSASVQLFHCAAKDLFNSDSSTTTGNPLCLEQDDGSAPAVSGEFTCYYSDTSDINGCPAGENGSTGAAFSDAGPHSAYYCIYSKATGALMAGTDSTDGTTSSDGACPPAAVGPPMRRKRSHGLDARGRVAGPKPAQALKARVETLRKRAALRRGALLETRQY